MNNLLRRLFVITTAAGLLVASSASTHAATSDHPALTGIAVDATGAALPGVAVTLTPNGGEAAAEEQFTDGSGHFAFDEIGAGTYTLVLALEGFEKQTFTALAVPADSEIKAVLKIAGLAETVVVRAETPADAIATVPIGESIIEQRVLSAVPLANDRFDDALPLLPGVVRGPDGLLNMNGARADQSAFLLNGVNMTDPVTGHFAVRLPLEAIESTNVHGGVQSAAYGSASGAITDVVIRAGSDKLDVQAQNFLPRPRLTNGGVRGIDSFTPRMRVSGPIRPGRIWFSQAASFRFVRTRVDELEPLDESEQKITSFDSVTQIDAALNNANRLTATFVAFPSNVDNAGIDTLHPYSVTPDLKQRGWIGAVTEGVVVGDHTTWSTTFAVKQYDMNVRPKSDGSSSVTVSGHTGSYFNHFDRDSERYDGRTTITIAAPSPWGDHLIRAGGEITYTSYNGIDASRSVTVTRADGSPLRQIDYFGNTEVGASNTTLGQFVEDQWAVGAKLNLHGGVRYAYEQIAGQQTLSPRFDAAYSLFENGRTIVKSGVGILYDKLPLNAADFDAQQSRRITDYDAQGNAAAVTVLNNRIADDGLNTPRTKTWNVEVDHRIATNLQARVGYREARGSDQLIVNPVDAENALEMSSGGRTNAKEFEFTVRRQFQKNGQVTASYVRSMAKGDLNDFVSVFGDLRDPIIRPDEYAKQTFDVPNRFLVWGTFALPHAVNVAPTFEYRNGFPYTVVDEAQQTVGARNDGGRFPNLFTMDLAVTKDVQITKARRARVGLQLFNLTNHFNPQDVQANTASPTYGEYANSVDRQVRAKFTLLF